MSVSSHLDQLRHKHEALKVKIREEERRPAVNHLEITAMKREKLHIKEEIEKARLQMEEAKRRGDWQKMSELQYGKLPELEAQLEAQARGAISLAALPKSLADFGGQHCVLYPARPGRFCEMKVAGSAPATVVYSTP